MKITKSKKILLISLLLLILGFILAAVFTTLFFDKCECQKYKVYSTLTIYPDMTFEKGKDSVCIVSSKGKAITTAILK